MSDFSTIYQPRLKLSDRIIDLTLEEKLKSEGMAYELATIYRAEKRYVESIKEIKKLIQTNKEIGYKLSLVEIYFENQLFEQALLQLDEVLEFQYDSILFRYFSLLLKTECLVGLSRTHEAIESIELAESIYVDDELLAWKGVTKMKLGNFDEAKLCFEKSISLNRNNEKAWLGLGSLHCLKGDLDLGLACYKMVLDTDSQNIAAHSLIKKFS